MTKSHDNVFTLKMVGHSNAMAVVSDYSIHSGQPWGGVSVETKSDGIVFHIYAGRKSDSNVAIWFKDKISGGGAIATSSFNTLPTKLNFAFEFDLMFEHIGKKIKGEKLVLAQGHNSADRNNWWLGGPNMSVLMDVAPQIIAMETMTFHMGIMPVLATIRTTFGNMSHMELGLVVP